MKSIFINIMKIFMYNNYLNLILFYEFFALYQRQKYIMIKKIYEIFSLKLWKYFKLICFFELVIHSINEKCCNSIWKTLHIDEQWMKSLLLVTNVIETIRNSWLEWGNFFQYTYLRNNLNYFLSHFFFSRFFLFCFNFYEYKRID